MKSDKRFTHLVEEMSGLPGVTPPGVDAPGRRRFGSNALKVDGKIFAMLVRGDLVVKLPPSRIAALIESGDCAPFTAGKDKPMKAWATVPSTSTVEWVALTREALDYVRGAA
jgi:hypothetical protein